MLADHAADPSRVARRPQVHKVLEDSSFVWRSMYAAHLRSWLRLFQSSQLLVVDPAALLAPERAPSGMRRIARFAGLPVDGGQSVDAAAGHAPAANVGIRDELLRGAASGGGEHEGVHENARRYILAKRPPPADVTQAISKWLRPHNCDLAGLLTRQGLLTRATEDDAPSQLPWLREELAEVAGGPRGACAQVVSVDEWFVGAS